MLFMKFNSTALICFALLVVNRSAYGQEKPNELTGYHKAILSLDAKEIRGGLPAEKMLDLCIPTSKRTLGRFTEYSFELLPGYHGLSLLAVDGLLKRAIEWSCAYTRTYFSELSADEEKSYYNLFEKNMHVPSERYLGRWGWDRPPMRLWLHKEPKSSGASK
jgi:hypothetical protein